ncbi:hypothetical protein CW304_28720 [Bacillus sp. UFRGS-B20]|nr:hypothetical protein CW304_28720 [Bacillus sp. UFRGS-B20]
MDCLLYTTHFPIFSSLSFRISSTLFHAIRSPRFFQLFADGCSRLHPNFSAILKYDRPSVFNSITSWTH